jgi:hypothetical protein
MGDKFFSLCDKSTKLGGDLFVNHGNKTLELSSCSKRIEIGFNESNVGFNNWATILDPVHLGVFVCVDISILKVLDVGFDHVLLITSGGIVLSLSQLI